MVDYRRNNEDLKVALREHSIHGYPLRVPIFGKALGVKTNTARDITGIVVEPAEPMSFEELAAEMRWSPERQKKAYWVDYARSKHMPLADREPLRWIYPKTRARLEEGYSVSEQEIRKDWLLAMDQVDKNDKIQSYSFDMNQVSMDPLEVAPGMIVQFKDSSTRDAGIPGRVIGIGEDPQDNSRIVYLETFEPVPALLAPKATAPWLIQPEFVPERTWVLGYGTVEAMKRKKVEVPAGMFDPKDSEHRVYYLDQPIPLADVREFCGKNYPKNPECIWQSMVLMVLPLHPAEDKNGRHQGGVFKPYPDDIRTTEIEAQIDYFGQGMEFED